MSDKPADSQAQSAPESILIDLGRQRRKKVKKLRRGEGSLYEDVQETISELKKAGTVAPDAQTVIVIVERKQDNGAFPFPVPFIDDDEDDDDD